MFIFNSIPNFYFIHSLLESGKEFFQSFVSAIKAPFSARPSELSGRNCFQRAEILREQKCSQIFNSRLFAKKSCKIINCENPGKDKLSNEKKEKLLEKLYNRNVSLKEYINQIGRKFVAAEKISEEKACQAFEEVLEEGIFTEGELYEICSKTLFFDGIRCIKASENKEYKEVRQFMEGDLEIINVIPALLDPDKEVVLRPFEPFKKELEFVAQEIIVSAQGIEIKNYNQKQIIKKFSKDHAEVLIKEFEKNPNNLGSGELLSFGLHSYAVSEEVDAILRNKNLNPAKKRKMLIPAIEDCLNKSSNYELGEIFKYHYSNIPKPDTSDPVLKQNSSFAEAHFNNYPVKKEDFNLEQLDVFSVKNEFEKNLEELNVNFEKSKNVSDNINEMYKPVTNSINKEKLAKKNEMDSAGQIFAEELIEDLSPTQRLDLQKELIRLIRLRGLSVTEELRNVYIDDFSSIAKLFLKHLSFFKEKEKILIIGTIKYEILPDLASKFYEGVNNRAVELRKKKCKMK